MTDNTTVKGNIVEIIYDNPETGYRILAVFDGKDTVTVRGVMSDVYVGADIVASGTWGVHPTYGPQFTASGVKVELPTTKGGIRAFLSSGLIPGVGPETAKKIVKKFGDATLDIIENEPEQLGTISGLSPRKITAICEAVAEHKDSSETIMFLSGLGVGTALALKAYKAYGKDAVNLVKDNPYRLADEIPGFGFPTADRIAFQLGIASDDINRITSCILYILKEIYVSGHCYLPDDILKIELQKFAKVDDELFDKALNLLTELGRVVSVYNGDKRNVYQRYIYSAERGIERLLIETDKIKIDCSTKTVEKSLTAFEKNGGIVLDENQRNAVISAATSGLLIITGGPGTGKTTIIKAILKVMSDQRKKCLLAAPTGRAAKRMSAACGEDAKTLHRLLEVDFSLDTDERNDENLRFKRNPEHPLECDCLIVDEVSMVDTVMMYHTLRALHAGTSVVLVGDKDQLPSVGPGKVLRDVIDSGKFRVATLTSIYRQNPDSLISMNAHRVNLGEMPEMNNPKGDFFLMTVPDGEAATQLTCDLVARRLPQKYGIDPLCDIQVITPNRRGTSGSVALSLALQNTLNPKRADKTSLYEGDTEFRIGDRVMQTKNNYDMMWEDYDDSTLAGEGVFNGEMGIIVEIDRREKLTYVLFDDNRYVCYDKLHLQELELCYAITVHKSQGSEFDYVIVPIVNVSPQLKTRNLIYTAITRAKKMAIIVGSQTALMEMVDNNTEVHRFTGLFAESRADK